METNIPPADGEPTGQPEDLLNTTIHFPNGSAFERLSPLITLRKDPGEGRIVYTCRRTQGTPLPFEPPLGSELVLKIKCQWPGPQNIILSGPSTYTIAELSALEKFTSLQMGNVPHLIAWKKATQSHHGIHPGGYVIYIIMTKLPGTALWDLGYWSISEGEREEIQAKFMVKLKEIRALGIKPYDCALRNVLWDRERREVGVLDFEHYEESDEPVGDETEELQRWGLVSRPPPRTWFQEWGLKGI